MKNKKDETRESPPKYRATSSKGMIPRLRFPEFRNAENWKYIQLSELLFENKERNRQLKYGPEEVLSVSGEYGCVNQIELLGRSFAGVSVKDYHVVDTGDIVYTKSPLKKNPFGIMKENKGSPGIVSTLYAVYHATALGHPAYLDQYFSRDYNLNSYLQPIVKKGAKNDMKVNNTAVLSGEIWVPGFGEQKKIAACLSSLDSLLAAHAKKLEALKDYKKGLMQLLFPAEGERVPRLRFPEFRAAKDWGNCQLRDISELITKGTTPTTLGYQYSDEGINFIKIESITLEGKLDINKMAHIDLECYDALSRSKLEENDILFSIAGALGVVTRIPSEMLPANTNQALGIVRLKKDINTAFIEHLLKAPKTQKLILGLKSGAAQSNISLQQLGELEICLPSSTEQQKIASTLSSLDSLIAAEARKIEELKEHKRGLMQGLFPSPEEGSELDTRK